MQMMLLHGTGSLTLMFCKLNSIFFLIRDKLNIDTMKIIYFSLVQSHLNYCNVIWGSTYKTHLKPLIISHKNIIRTMTYSKRRDSSEPIFIRLGLLNFNSINKYSILLFVYKCINNIYSINPFTFANEIHGRTLRNALNLRPPLVNSHQSQLSVRYQGVEAWNALSLEIQSSNTLLTFKRRIKQILLSN